MPLIIRPAVFLLVFAWAASGCAQAIATAFPLQQNPATDVPATQAPAGMPTAPGLVKTLPKPGSTLVFGQTPVSSPTPLPSVEPARPAGTLSPARNEVVVQKAIQELAGRLGISPAEIQVIEFKPDEFPAGDLGCPQPGVKPPPIPALVTGQVIVLEARGARYIYHTHALEVRFCGSS